MHITSAVASAVADAAAAACSASDSPVACFRAHRSMLMGLLSSGAGAAAAAPVTVPLQQLHGLAPSMRIQPAFLGTSFGQTIEIIIVAAAALALLLCLCGCYCICCARSRNHNKGRRDGVEQPVVDPTAFARAEQLKAYENEQLQMTQQKQANMQASTVPASTNGVPAYSTVPPAASAMANPYVGTNTNSNSNSTAPPLPHPATNPYANANASGATVPAGAAAGPGGAATSAVESVTVRDVDASLPTDESSAPSSGRGSGSTTGAGAGPGTGMGTRPAVSALNKSAAYTGVPLPHASRGFAYDNEVPLPMGRDDEDDHDAMDHLPVSEFGVAAPMQRDIHGEEQQRTLGNWTRDSN